MEGEDWDLHAVVRGCSASASVPSTTTYCSQFFSPLHQNRGFTAGKFQDLFEPRREKFIQESQVLYKPFFPAPHTTPTVFSPQSLPISPLSVLRGLQDLLAEQQQSSVKPPLPPQKHQSFSTVNVIKTKSSASHCSSSRLKRRKNHSKRVCHVPVESLSSDLWSWRKYGQKPIKGSPYPRGYYRCSTLKGCMARKQVERNRSDPGMFIVTYTGEHNHPMPAHRNSLAGVIRQNNKQVTDDPSKPICSPDMSPEDILSPATEKLESGKEGREEFVGGEDEEDDFRVLEDDFFAGLEDLVCPAMGDCLSDQFPASLQFPWLARNVTTTAAGGG